MTRILFLLSSVWLAASSGAQAADIIDAPETAPASDEWTGLYGGIGATYADFSDVDGRFPGFESTGDGYGLSVHLGYMQQFDNFVLGIEADYTYLDENFTTLPPGFPPLKVEHLGSLRLRAGYAFDWVQPYVTGGVGYANTVSPSPFVPDLEDFGLVLGAGLDFKLTENILVGVSYQHHWYRDFDNQPIDADMDIVNVRVSFKF